ncbi:MAG: manganese catalase family protein, partial [Eubacteriales bacterium]
MWNYEKRLQFPVNIKKPDARAAMVVMSQYGGPDGELGASLRYLSQRYSMPYGDITGLLTDIGMSCLKCSHTSQTVPVRNSVPHSTCVGANLNKHQFSPC